MAVALRKFVRAIMKVIHGLEKRPWIPMVAYLACFALFILVAWIPLVNLIDSKWRPMPELSSSAKLIIGEIGGWIFRFLQVIGVISVVVVPFAMLCAMRFRSAFYTLVMGITAVAVSATFMLLTTPIWFVLGIEELDARQEMGKDKVVKVYKDYNAAAAASKDLGKIVPLVATDITVVHQVCFQGYSDNLDVVFLMKTSRSLSQSTSMSLGNLIWRMTLGVLGVSIGNRRMICCSLSSPKCEMGRWWITIPTVSLVALQTTILMAAIQTNGRCNMFTMQSVQHFGHSVFGRQVLRQ